MSHEIRRGQVLDEQTHFLINNLIVDETLLSALLRDGVFSGEMLDKIRSRRTDVEKASSLVDLLKRRGIEAFDKFLLILTETHHRHVSDHLQDCLSQLATTRCSTRHGTTQAIRNRSTTSDDVSTSDDEPSSKPATAAVVNDNSARCYRDADLRLLDKDELIEIIRRRNQTIDRLESDYREMKSDNEEALRELQETDEDMQELISENETLRKLVRTDKHRSKREDGVTMTTVIDLKQQIAERTERVRETERRLEVTREELATVESCLRRAADTRRKIARELHLDDDATDADLLLKLKDMKQSSDKDRQRAADVERQLGDLRRKIATLEDQKRSLVREHEKLSFRVRQLDHQIAKQSRREGKFHASVPLTPLQHVITPIQLNLLPNSKCVPPINDRTPSHHQTAFQLYLNRRKRKEQQLPATDRIRLRYCVLCRSDFVLPGKQDEPEQLVLAAAAKSSSNQECRVHHLGVVDGSYECCGDATDWKPGCVTVKYHVYVERDTATGKLFLTDGVKRLVDANIRNHARDGLAAFP